MTPCLLHEDEHLLVVHKPPGWATHAPSPWAGEGLYEWLRHREPRWATLAIVHRLDKETSGVLVFTKTTLANRALTDQFARHTVRKRYLLVTDRPVHADQFVVESYLVRQGPKYVSRARGSATQWAQTRFRLLARQSNRTLLEAWPVTGRTHQVRVHAAQQGLPILGDTLYGGTPAARVYLRADTLSFQHPATGREVTFRATEDFDLDPRLQLRRCAVEVGSTTAFRLLHGASDGWPGWYVDRLGAWLLSQAEGPPTAAQLQLLRQWLEGTDADAPSRCVSPETVGLLDGLQGVYHKHLRRDLQQASLPEASPQLILGRPAPDRFVVLENGLRYELSFAEGYSVGLFLDQRENRRRLLCRHVAAGFPLLAGAQPQPGPAPCASPELTSRSNGAPSRPGSGGSGPPWTVLNTFAYTCGFSVCAARAGARVTSVDLSRKYLDWGRRNFELNGLDPGQHEFWQGDVLDWLRRLARQGRRFDVVILDPPTFSRSKAHGVFRAETDYPGLVAGALAVLKPGGVLLAATNAGTIGPEVFVNMIEQAVRAGGGRIAARHYVPQPPDFPVTRAEPPHLKTLWLRVEVVAKSSGLSRAERPQA